MKSRDCTFREKRDELPGDRALPDQEETKNPVIGQRGEYHGIWAVSPDEGLLETRCSFFSKACSTLGLACTLGIWKAIAQQGDQQGDGKELLQKGRLQQGALIGDEGKYAALQWDNSPRT